MSFSAIAVEFGTDETYDMTGKISFVSSNWLTINLCITMSWQFFKENSYKDNLLQKTI
jgi:hypothetical protein